MHGLDQSNALTVAAQQLSKALQKQRNAAWKANTHDPDIRTRGKEELTTANHEVGVAKAVYRAAYKAYTNPFGVEKTFS